MEKAWKRVHSFRLSGLDDRFIFWIKKNTKQKTLSAKIKNALKQVYQSEIYQEIDKDEK